MNKHRRLLKTNNVQWIRILLCIVPLIVPSCARITYDEAKFNLFEKKSTEFEFKILESLQSTINFFAQPEVHTAVLIGLLSGLLVTPLAAPTSVLFVFNALLAEESDWRGAFASAITSETKREIASFAVESMDSTIKTIGKKYHLMTDNSSDVVERKIVASEITSNIDRMLNMFDRSNSLFKLYPLIATPILAQLAQLVAVFDPLAKSILKGKARNGELSCIMRNILLDYRPRAVNDRMERVHSDDVGTVHEVLSYVLHGAYSPFGYSITIPPSFNCERRSDKSNVNMYDEFGDSYDIKFETFTSCVRDYGLFVRHRVEQFYPPDIIDILNSSCSITPQATGFGWFTIKLKHVRARMKLSDGNKCDLFSKCDSFVKLFVNGGEPKLVTPPRYNTASYDLGITYISPKITKKASVKIEVWHQNNIFENTLLLQREGTVDSFLSDGFMKHSINGPINYIEMEKNIRYDENHLDTISFWQDEYKY